jgi:predicted DNA-binding transcriptional regulator YafY
MIEILNEAVTNKRKVSFTYLRYGLDKKLKPRRSAPYAVSPYGLVYANERYYLVCAYGEYPVSHYRIDRMKDAVVLGEPAKPAPKNFNLQEYTDRAVYLFGGAPETIVLDCDEDILDDVIDRFGLGIDIKPSGEGRFRAKVIASSRGMLFWALQYLPYCEVLEPVSLRQLVIEALKNNPYV